VRAWLIVIAVLLLGAVASAAFVYWPREKPVKTGAAGGHKGHEGDRSDERDPSGGGHGVTKPGDAKEDDGQETDSNEKGGGEKGGEKTGEPRAAYLPGSVIPDKSADLYAKVSGYLQELGVDLDNKPIDIGSRVQKGQILAVIDMPELKKEVLRDEASVKRAKATVEQMKARITTANADFKAATAMVTFRTKVFRRLDRLEKDHVMDKKVVDEKEEQMHAAEEAKNAAEAKILQAEADLEEALAEVELAQATLERAQVDLDYATIKSPYNGVITARNYWPGDFIRAHEEGGKLPLLAVHKIDVVRVVVLIPDMDVPHVNPGNKATVTIDNLPNKNPRDFEGTAGPVTVSRIANAQDPTTRNMRVEIDLVNKDGDLRAGMYGHVTIILDHADSAVTKAGR
jgi:HlyD family secretion protein